MDIKTALKSNLFETHQKMTSRNGELVYFACPYTCKICLNWNKKYNIWKSFAFFPKHCYLCSHSGLDEDFTILKYYIVCVSCFKEYKKRYKIMSKQRFHNCV